MGMREQLIHGQQLARAQEEVARILRTLEEETGSVVRAVNIDDIETTCISSPSKQFERIVHIDIERLPGSNWGQARD